MEVATPLKTLFDNNEVFIAPEEAVQQQPDDRHRMYIFNRCIYLENFEYYFRLYSFIHFPK